MAHNNTEIEIQVEVQDSKPLLEFLEKEGEFKGEKRQIDEYFSPKDNDFTKIRPIKEWLRLRNSQGKYSLNYKNWHYDEQGKSHHADEYETEIKNLEEMKKALFALNFKSLVIVDKIRKVYHYKDYEIAIDKVKGLADSVEIEYIGKDEKAVPKEVTKEMVNFLKDKGCGEVKITYQGYPFRLLFPEEVRWEEM